MRKTEETKSEELVRTLNALFDAGEIDLAEAEIERRLAQLERIRQAEQDTACGGKEGFFASVSLTDCPLCAAAREAAAEAEAEEYDAPYEITLLNEAASFYRGRSNWEKCLPLYDRLIARLTALQECTDESTAIAHINRGTGRRMMGDGSGALEDFDQAEKILHNLELLAEEGADAKKEDLAAPVSSYTWASLYNNRAPIYAQTGEAEHAKDDYLKALAWLREVPDTLQEQGITLAALALVTLQMEGAQETARSYADQAMEIYRSQGEAPHSGSILSARAHCAFRAGEYKEAAKLFRSAAESIKRFFGENADYANCMSNYEYTLRQAEAMAMDGQ